MALTESVSALLLFRIKTVRKTEKQEEKRRFLVKVSRVSMSPLLLREDRAPTLLPRASLIGSLSANMLPCALTLTKTDRLERHTAAGSLCRNSRGRTLQIM